MTESPSPHIARFLEAAEKDAGADARAAMERLIEIAHSQSLRVAAQKPHPSKGETLALVIPGLDRWVDATPVILFSRGRISWQLKVMRQHRPFGNPALERQLRDRLASLPSTELDKPDWPDTLIEDVETDEGLAAFREILEWTVTRIRRANPG